MGATRRARLSSSTLTLESPMCQIFPAACKSARAPIGILQRHPGIGRVQLVEIDSLQLQASQAPFASGAKMLGPTVPLPSFAPRSGQAPLGRDDDPLGIRIESVRNQLLADIRAIGVGGVDQRDAQLDDALEHAPRLPRLKRLTPDARPAKPHRAKSEATDRHVIAEDDGAAVRFGQRPLSAHEPWFSGTSVRSWLNRGYAQSRRPQRKRNWST